MNLTKKPKWLLLTSPLFILSILFIGNSITQIEFANDIRYILYITGAIILSIGLSILDNKINEK